MNSLINLEESDLDRSIYRIISLPRLYDLFERGHNVLVNPKLWDDPFENFILRSKVRQPNGEMLQYSFHEEIYGQCWTLNKASDAMWRIYSHNNEGVRMRTTVRKLLESLLAPAGNTAELSCCIGRVRYQSEKQLARTADSAFDEDGILHDNIFRSLLVKRKAFKHENEVRLLYFNLGESSGAQKFSYEVDPHLLIDQLMLDPRIEKKRVRELKDDIARRTGYKGPIKRSLLYRPPKKMIVSAMPSSLPGSE